MRCDDFEIRLQDLFDERRRVEDDPALGEHMSDCPACRALAESMTLAVEAATHLPLSVGPADLDRRVLGELFISRRILQLPTARSWWSTAAAAAIVAVLVLPLGYWIGKRSAQASQDGLNVRPGVANAKSDAPADVAIQKAESPFEDTTKTQDQLAGGLFNRLPRTNDANRDMSDVPWSQEVREGLQPLTQGTMGALNSLWEALPPTAEDSRS